MKKDENLGSWIFFSWILMIDAICQRQTNHLQTFGWQCRKIICHWIFTKQKKHLLALWPVTIALGLSCLQNERWLPSILQNRISNILFHVICWFRRAWTCKTYWTTANYKSIRFIVIYCVLISTNVQFSDQNALHDSNQVLPCNRFFSFLCEIWLSFTRKLLTLNLSSARYLYQWEKVKDLVSVRGFLLVLNSRLVVNNAPTSY